MKSQRAPVFFIDHGSPMNALADNSFTRALNRMGDSYPEPKAILCISAHWTTKGTWVTHMEKPQTIHDFRGFPQALFDVRYPAPGSPKLAEKIRDLVRAPKIQLDDAAWGLDHGAWSVLRHLYPKAQIPVVQLSLDMTQPAEYHLALGEKLRPLREDGVLIVGAGNIVHNLREMTRDPGAPPQAWAAEFDAWVKNKVVEKDFSALARDYDKSTAGKRSTVDPDHYFPLLYAVGASEKKDEVRVENEGIEYGSLSQRCFSFWPQ